MNSKQPLKAVNLDSMKSLFYTVGHCKIFRWVWEASSANQTRKRRSRDPMFAIIVGGSEACVEGEDTHQGSFVEYQSGS